MNDNDLKPLHILYLIDEIKVKGGTEKHLLELVTGMAEAGFRVSVFALAEGGYAREFKNNPKIMYRCIDVEKIYDLKGLTGIYRLARFIQCQQVDVLQTIHTASDLVGPIAARLSIRNPKVLSSRRDLGYTKSLRHVKMQRYINHFVDGILGNSSAVKTSVIDQEDYPQGKITVIFNGIDGRPFQSNSKDRNLQRSLLGFDEQAILIGSVGNIRPVKGYDLLVEAAAVVCREFPRVQFLHVGEGELKETLEARCKELGIDDNFRFLGATDNVPGFLSALDIYVQPSRSEGMSNAIMEAMAARLPVVATDVGGNPDLIEHAVTGLLAPGENSAVLAERLLQLVRQPQTRSRLAECAYRQVQERFQISCMIENYKNTYVKLMKNDCTPKTCC